MITYIYGTMNSGKTAQAVMLYHSLAKQGKKVQVYKVDPSVESVVKGSVSSRANLSCDCLLVNDKHDFSKDVMVNQDINAIIVDECQFLSEKQVEYLCYLNNIEIILVGLKVNYLGKVFDSSQKIMSYEPKMVHLPSYCSSPNCMKHATHHLLEVNGEIIRHGNEVSLGDIEGDTKKYHIVCKMHYEFIVTTV